MLASAGEAPAAADAASIDLQFGLAARREAAGNYHVQFVRSINEMMDAGGEADPGTAVVLIGGDGRHR